MRTNISFRRGLLQAFLLIGALSAGTATLPAQTPETRGMDSLALPEINPIAGSVGYKDLYCAGYIQSSPFTRNGQIVGGEQEQEQRTYSQGDYVYLDTGAQQGVRVGQEFAIVRPRGTVRSKFSRKDKLGVFIQEIGQLRVVSVKDKVSVALVTTTCETILSGDILTEVPARIATFNPSPTNFDRFSDPNGKAVGRVVLARDGQELVTRNQIVYIDLGAEDKVQSGDRLTIFRPAGTGNLTNFKDDETARGATGDFGSNRYKGGKFSTMAPRSKESSPGVYNGNVVTTPQVKASRPPMPRKNVGEMVILKVQERTATALITVVAQEIHPGDYVEIK